MGVFETRMLRAAVPEKSARRLADYVAPPLILLAPYLHFLEHHGYGLFHPEALVIALPLVALGLLAGVVISRASNLVRVLLISAVFTVFLNLRGVYGFFEIAAGCAIVAWLFREHLTTILAVGFAVLIATTYIFSSYEPNRRSEFPEQPMSATQQSLPPIVHLVLDEHIGVEGIPQNTELGKSVKAELKEFYANHGFRVHGGAYSQYFKTYDSLSNLFNFTTSAKNSQYFPKGASREPYVMDENHYFSTLAERGYRFRIYQSDYLSFCDTAGVPLLSCSRYGNTIKAIEPLGMPVTEKSVFILNSFLHPSSTVSYWRKQYRNLRLGLRERGIELPGWENKYRIGVLAMTPILQQLKDDLAGSANGTVFFAHLLLPHYPYLYRTDCTIHNKVEEWWRRKSDDFTKPLNNSTESRDARYVRYLVQVRCQQKLLEEVFQTMRAAGVLDGATIVLHGDHGSRISIHDPLAELQSEVSDEDIVDHYSAMFAIKGPQIESGYTDRLEPLQNLLARMMKETPPVAENYVYLLGKRHEVMQKRTINKAMWTRF